MSDKPKFSFAAALDVAEWIVRALAPACERIEIAGSLRRQQKTVGDIEILYVPKLQPGRQPDELIATWIDLSLSKIWDLINAGVLVRRQNTNGQDTFGPRNKLMRHSLTGIPVDLFATDERSWFNYLVCRTGPAAFNIRVATRARALGWKWHPYDCGFSRERVHGLIEWQVIRSEEALFEFLGWAFQAPAERKSVEQKTGAGELAQPAAQGVVNESGLDRGVSTHPIVGAQKTHSPMT